MFRSAASGCNGAKIQSFVHFNKRIIIFLPDEIRSATLPAAEPNLGHVAWDSGAKSPRYPTGPAPEGPVGRAPWRCESCQRCKEVLCAGAGEGESV